MLLEEMKNACGNQKLHVFIKRPAKGWGVNSKYYGYTVGSGGKMVDNFGYQKNEANICKHP